MEETQASQAARSLWPFTQWEEEESPSPEAGPGQIVKCLSEDGEWGGGGTGHRPPALLLWLPLLWFALLRLP